ncbi:MAG: GHKL domain-containing protein, partial [Planctomycetota bacterium]
VESLANQVASLAHKLSLIYWMSRIIQEETEVNLFFRKSLICLLEGIRGARGCIYLYLINSGLEKVAELSLREITPYEQEKKLVLEAYSHGRTIIRREVVNQEKYTLLALPLRAHKKITGILYIENTGFQNLESEDFHFLNIGANIFAVNAENRRLIHHLKKTQKNLEEYSASSEILASIAHELKNPITTASGFAELLLKKEENGGKKKHLEFIDKELLRSVKIIENMLSFARKRKPSLCLEDVNQVLLDALKREELNMPRTIELKTELNPHPLMAEVDFIQLEQVFINLLKNASEAIQETQMAGKIYVKSWQDENSIYISIRDTGIGFPEKESSNIFKPFFTTKSFGTGLGLSLCYHILEAHHGQIFLKNVKDEEGGVEALVRLPLFRET